MSAFLSRRTFLGGAAAGPSLQADRRRDPDLDRPALLTPGVVVAVVRLQVENVVSQVLGRAGGERGEEEREQIGRAHV